MEQFKELDVATIRLDYTIFVNRSCLKEPQITIPSTSENSVNWAKTVSKCFKYIWKFRRT